MPVTMDLTTSLQQIATDGYALLSGVFDANQIDFVATGLADALNASDESGEAIRTPCGVVYAARNVLSQYPHARDIWRQPPLPELLSAVLGTGFGLVRGLFFDKPPEGTWSLPWHQDRTIAVRDNRLPSKRFTKPTRKAGVPHVEAPNDVLEGMLTLRIHLDHVTPENGPLCVAPGSHVGSDGLRFGDRQAVAILAACGDVLAIRPLVAHCSGQSAPGTTRHRRVLHLEFAASRILDDGFEWYEFSPFEEIERRLETPPTITGKRRLPMPPSRNIK